MSNQYEYFKKHDDTLEMYTKALVRAHGQEHPEVYKVREVYEHIQAKVKDNEDFADEINELKSLTDNFEIPNDVCETYEKTYLMFKEVYDLKKEEIS